MPSSSSKSAAAPAENECAALLKQLDKGVRHHIAPLAAIDQPAFVVLSTEAGTANRVYDALARLRQRFVDWNEMRVARRTEIARVLHSFPDAERRAVRLRMIYNRLFEEKGRLELGFLAGQKYTDGRRILLHIWPTLPAGAVSLLLFEFCPGGQLPLSDGGLREARRLGLVGKQGSRPQLQQKIVSELAADEAVRLLQHLELAAHGHPYGTDWNQPEPKLTRAGRAAVKAEAAARAAAQPSMIPLPASASSEIRASVPADAVAPKAPAGAKKSSKKSAAKKPAAKAAAAPAPKKEAPKTAKPAPAPKDKKDAAGKPPSPEAHGKGGQDAKAKDKDAKKTAAKPAAGKKK